MRNGVVFYEYNRRLQAPINLGEIAQSCGYKVNRLTDVLGISSRQLERNFDHSLGITPKSWMRQQRMIRARHMIREGLALKTIAADLGFSKYDKFAQELRKVYEVSPAQMIRIEKKYCFEPLLRS